MGQLVHAIESLLDTLEAIEWRWVALALACHLAKMLARTRAWRTILCAAYPGTRIRWRAVLGAYLAGAGVNALLPARSGDVLKLYIVKRRVEPATYPTLAATLAVETIVDAVLASALVAWALAQGVLPGLDVVPRLPSIDLLWLFQSPRLAAGVGVAALVAGFVLGLAASRRIGAFRRRVAQGAAVLRTPRRYLRGVVLWQLADWLLRLATVASFLAAFGIDVSARNVLLVQVTQSLATVVPLTPGGIGTEQALIVYVLSGRVPASAAIALSVGMKLALMLANTVLGLLAVALMLRTLRFRRALGRARARERLGEQRAP